MSKLYRYLCNDCQKPYYYLKAVQNHMVKRHDYVWWDNRDVCKKGQLHNPTGPVLPQMLGEDSE